MILRRPPLTLRIVAFVVTLFIRPFGWRCEARYRRIIPAWWM